MATKLFLDDIRNPPEGWMLVRTLSEAKNALINGVDEASLDHDLGACDACMGGLSVEEWLMQSRGQAMPHCEHVGTGYQLVCWMEETGFWPKSKPKVHSANPVGRLRMLIAIERSFPAPAE